MNSQSFLQLRSERLEHTVTNISCNQSSDSEEEFEWGASNIEDAEVGTSLQSLISLASQSSYLEYQDSDSPGPSSSSKNFVSTNTVSTSPSPFRFYLEEKPGPSKSTYCCIASFEEYGSALAISGNLLYSGSQTADVLVSNQPSLVEPNEHARFGCGEGVLKAILITDDIVFTAHQDHKIRVWYRSMGPQIAHKLLSTLPTKKDYLYNFIPQKNYVQIRRHHKRLWIQHVDTISALALGPEGLLYSGSWDKTVKVWKLSTLRCIESISAHDDAVNAVVVGSDGFLYTASADSTVKVWSKIPGMNEHVLISTLEGHKSSVNALALQSEGDILYSGGSDCSINVWEREDSASFMYHAVSLLGHRQAILCLAVTGSILCSGSADKTIRVWRKVSGILHSCLAVLEGHKGPVKCISASLDTFTSCLVYSGSLDSSSKLWSVSLEEEGEASPSIGSSPLLAPRTGFRL